MLIPIKRIHVDEDFNCRGKIVDVGELARSLRDCGQLAPIIVKENDLVERTVLGGKDYTLIAGFRRITAARSLGWEEIDCKVMKVNENEAMVLNFVENVQRAQLTIEEEAKTVEKLLKLWAPRTVCEKINQTPTWLKIRMAYNRMPLMVRLAVNQKELTQKDLLQLDNLLELGVKEDFILDRAKLLKDKKQRGKQSVDIVAPVIAPPKPKLIERPRTAAEVKAVLDHIYDTIGPNEITRTLAWVHGGISTEEFFDAIGADNWEDFQ